MDITLKGIASPSSNSDDSCGRMNEKILDQDQQVCIRCFVMFLFVVYTLAEMTKNGKDAR